eukprot:s1_g1257.t1
MNRIVTLGACAALSLAAFGGTAQALEGSYYVSVGGGANWVDDISAAGSTLELDMGYSVHAAVGFQSVDDPDVGRFRVDVEVFYSDTDNDTITTGGVATSVGGGLENFGVMANGYFDFLPDSVIRPYIGVGAGIVETDLSISVAGFTASGDSTEFAYRAAAGASYDITDEIALDVGYRYMNVNTNVDIDSHNAVVSLRYGF